VIRGLSRASAALIGLLIAATAYPAGGPIAPALWDRPRTATSVLEQETIRSAVLAALAKPDAQIILHHAPGSEPQVQAEELRSWLGALAIDFRRIAVRADAAPGAPLRIEVMP
jgi:hypothetical protein